MDVDRMYANIARFGPNGPDAADASIDDLFHQGVDWIELMKTVRQIHDVSLDEATRLVLVHEGWRHWVTQRINSDAKGRKNGVGPYSLWRGGCTDREGRRAPSD
jgi:hypothetical protein